MDIPEFSGSLTTYGRRSRAITPSDTVDLPNGPVKSLIVTADGDVSFLPVDNPDDDPVTITGLSVGNDVPFIIRRVLATGTTATVRTIED